MKKTALLIGFVIMLPIAYAFSFEAFGWRISWNEEPEIINEVGDMQIQFISEFDKEIKIANSRKEIQLFLKELGYERIGVIDTSTGMGYTIVISDDGIIQGIENGLNEPEVVIRADLPIIRERLENGQILAVRKSLEIPFKMKIRILLMRWF